MYKFKKIGKLFTSKFVGTGPSSCKKSIYRAAISQRLRNSALYCAIRKAQGNYKGLKLNGIHQFLVNAASFNLLGESTYTVQKNKEVLLVVVKNIGLEIDAEKIKYMFLFRYHYAGQNCNIQIDW